VVPLLAGFDDVCLFARIIRFGACGRAWRRLRSAPEQHEYRGQKKQCRTPAGFQHVDDLPNSACPESEQRPRCMTTAGQKMGIFGPDRAKTGQTPLRGRPPDADGTDRCYEPSRVFAAASDRGAKRLSRIRDLAGASVTN
jgi:hypothetical protein